MNLILKPEQVDIYNIKYHFDEHVNHHDMINTNIVYRDKLFTLNSIYIVIKLNSNNVNKMNYVTKTDLSQLINIEYNMLQNTKNKYPIYNIKKRLFTIIKQQTKLTNIYINITGIWENNTQCGLIYTIT